MKRGFTLVELMAVIIIIGIIFAITFPLITSIEISFFMNLNIFCDSLICLNIVIKAPITNIMRCCRFFVKQKNRNGAKSIPMWCGRRDLNPHGITTGS